MNFYLDRTAPKSCCGSSLTTGPPLPAALGTMLLNATLSALGALSISLGGGSDPSVPWLQGGGIAFRDHAVWYASDCEQTTASRCAPLLPEMGSTVPRSGTDSIGTYTEASVDYVTAKGAKPKFVTGVRSYADAPDVDCAGYKPAFALFDGLDSPKKRKKGARKLLKKAKAALASFFGRD